MVGPPLTLENSTRAVVEFNSKPDVHNRPPMLLSAGDGEAEALGLIDADTLALGLTEADGEIDGEFEAEGETEV